jgi:hypothetical protein
MGVLLSDTVWYGIDVITPAVIASPAESTSLSREWIDARFECLDERDPEALPPVEELSKVPSSRPSDDFSLCSFLPNSDLPAVDCCLGLLSPGFEEGIFTSVILAAWSHEDRSLAAGLPASATASPALLCGCVLRTLAVDPVEDNPLAQHVTLSLCDVQNLRRCLLKSGAGRCLIDR